MNRAHAMPFFFLLLSAWLLKLVLSYYFSWLLLPDFLLLILLATQLHYPMRLRWSVALPFSVLLDIGAGLPLGFHGAYFSATVLILYPLGLIWSLFTQLSRLMLVIGIAALIVLSKWLFVYIVTDEPAANGWWLTVIANALCWPMAQWLAWRLVPPATENSRG